MTACSQCGRVECLQEALAEVGALEPQDTAVIRASGLLCQRVASANAASNLEWPANSDVDYLAFHDFADEEQRGVQADEETGSSGAFWPPLGRYPGQGS